MSPVPGVNTFSETSALYSVMEKDLNGARQICADMTRNERVEFAEKLKVLRVILDDLNADYCLHCGGRIGKVNPDQIRGGRRGETIWFHYSSHGSACPQGDTTAEPVPNED